MALELLKKQADSDQTKCLSGSEKLSRLKIYPYSSRVKTQHQENHAGLK